VPAAQQNTQAATSDKSTDYTLTIIQKDGLLVVHEGGVPITKPLDRKYAEWWADQHRKWYQPRCCVCGNAVTKPNDPWIGYSSNSQGTDWLHTNCEKKSPRGRMMRRKKGEPDRWSAAHSVHLPGVPFCRRTFS
jgi:hypothetical protein